MGSKKLKAIAVRGTGKVEPADRKRVAALAKRPGEVFRDRCSTTANWWKPG